MKNNAAKEKTYSVGEICSLTGVTRKTLFYYDRIALLKP
ncbi:MAG: MerR family transcriptional regulator [Solobacterium sp.]|nr:MerR family transcriptional regulator [Solobacterium sp.]